MTDMIYRKGDKRMIEKEKTSVTGPKSTIEDRYAGFIDELCDHIRVVGGVGNPETFSKMSLEEAFKHLYPNGIVLGFKNMRMMPKFQLCSLLKHIDNIGDFYEN